MTNEGIFFKGTYGFAITIDLGSDLTQAASASIAITTPSGALITRTLPAEAIPEPKTAGLVRYVPAQDETEEAGVYTFELTVLMTGGGRLRTQGQYSITDRNLGPAVVVETGAGTLLANSYISIVDADFYFGTRLYSDAWNKASRFQKSAALTTATRMIDNSFQFAGDRTWPEQPLSWPRRGVPDRERVRSRSIYGPLSGRLDVVNAYQPLISQIVVPRDISYSQCEIAILMLQSDRTADPKTAGIGSMTVGPLAFTFNSADRPKVIPDHISAVLNRYSALSENFRPILRV